MGEHKLCKDMENELSAQIDELQSKLETVTNTAVGLLTQYCGGHQNLNFDEFFKKTDGKCLLCCIEKIEQLERQQVDCNQCANRGRVKGVSQESYCSHCIHQEKWRVDHFVGGNNKHKGDEK